MFGAYLKELREQKGFSQRQLAYLAGVSNTEISKLESGGRKNPSPRLLEKLAPHLGVSHEKLMEKAGHIKMPSLFDTKLRENGEKYLGPEEADLELISHYHKLSPESQRTIWNLILSLEIADGIKGNEPERE